MKTIRNYNIDGHPRRKGQGGGGVNDINISAIVSGTQFLSDENVQVKTNNTFRLDAYVAVKEKFGQIKWRVYNGEGTFDNVYYGYSVDLSISIDGIYTVECQVLTQAGELLTGIIVPDYIEVSPIISSSNYITKFTFYAANNDALTVNQECSIVGTNITRTVPFGTDMTDLTPTIVHNGDSINPASLVAQDFSNPVQYQVTAANGAIRTYTVTLAEAAPVKAVYIGGDDRIPQNATDIQDTGDIIYPNPTNLYVAPWSTMYAASGPCFYWIAFPDTWGSFTQYQDEDTLSPEIWNALTDAYTITAGIDINGETYRLIAHNGIWSDDFNDWFASTPINTKLKY